MNVTCPQLSNLGRLGNQLWQIASTIGIARRNSVQPEFTHWYYSKFFSFPEEFWSDNPSGMSAENFANHIAPTHRPYLQDLSLWIDSKKEIISYLQPSELAVSIIKLNNEEFFSIPADQKISIHIRRGDAVMVGPALYPLQSKTYIHNALSSFGAELSGKILCVFSDDLSWCQGSGFVDVGIETMYMLGNSDWQDMLLMSMCKNHIIANSSFSYWGATISSDPHVRYPYTWYGPAFHDLDYRLMIQDGWIGIDDPHAGRVL